LDGAEARDHFKDILYNRVCFFVSDEHPDVDSVQILSGKFAKEFSELEDALEKKGEGNPLHDLYRRSEESELGQAEKRVRSRLGY